MTAPSPTLAALLALLDEREPLDVGPCPACGGSKRGEPEYDDWALSPPNGPGEEWAYVGLGADLEREAPGLWERRRREQCGRVLPHWYKRERPCPECSEPGPEVECESCEGLCGQIENDEGGWSPAPWPEEPRPKIGAGAAICSPSAYPCSDCGRKGKRPGPPQPTGRDRRTPGQALRDALGLEWVAIARIAHRSSRAPTPSKYAEIDRRIRLDGEWWVAERLVNNMAAPDPAAQTALWPYADELQARGDILGQAIALALAGECRECRECEGRGWHGVAVEPASQVLQGLGVESTDTLPCPKCNGEGAAVGELAAEVRALHLQSIVDMPAKEPAPA